MDFERCDKCGAIDYDVWIPLEEFKKLTGVTNPRIHAMVHANKWWNGFVVKKEYPHGRGHGVWVYGNIAHHNQYLLNRKGGGRNGS